MPGWLMIVLTSSCWTLFNIFFFSFFRSKILFFLLGFSFTDQCFPSWWTIWQPRCWESFGRVFPCGLGCHSPWTPSTCRAGPAGGPSDAWPNGRIGKSVSRRFGTWKGRKRKRRRMNNAFLCCCCCRIAKRKKGFYSILLYIYGPLSLVLPIWLDRRKCFNGASLCTYVRTVWHIMIK